MIKPLGVLLSLMMASTALAQAVWVKNGKTTGQGQLFRLEQQCVAVTPAHVVRGAGDRIRLTDEKGDIFFATVLEKDEKKDVALLIVGEASDLHGCRMPLMASLARLGEYEADVIGTPGAWFDLIASPAGGLDRFDVTLPKRLPSVAETEFTVSIKTGPDPTAPTKVDGTQFYGEPLGGMLNEVPHRGFNRMPMQGNSGAILWIGTRASGHFTTDRYDWKSNSPTTFLGGIVVGMLLRVAGDSAYLLTLPAMTEFIAQTLRPMDSSKLVIDSAGATITDRGRGESINFYRAMVPGLLNDLSIEFDLGDEDAEFHGVSVLYDVGEDPDHRYDPHPRFRIVSSSSPEAPVMTVSQFRPREGREWRSVECKNFKWEPVFKLIMPGQIRLNCELTRPVVARGIRVTLRGVPGRWRGLKLNLVRS